MGELTPAFLTKARTQLMRAKDRRLELSKIRDKLPLEHIAPFVRSLSQFPYFQRIYSPDAVPKSYSEIRRRFILTPSSLDRELAWTASVLKNYEQILSSFVALERRFVDAWMLGQFEVATAVLNEVEEQHGKSGWLIERRLALLQEAAGLDAQKVYSYKIRGDEASSVWAKFYAFNFSMRMEPTVSTASYVRMVEGQASKAEQPEFRNVSMTLRHLRS